MNFKQLVRFGWFYFAGCCVILKFNCKISAYEKEYWHHAILHDVP